MNAMTSTTVFLESVERVLVDAIFDGDPRIETIASRMKMSTRSLQRKLQAAGTSHRKLLGDTRLRLAESLLSKESITQSNIARTLGYSGATAFNRAFKGWTGRPPGQAEVAIAQATPQAAPSQTAKPAPNAVPPPAFSESDWEDSGVFSSQPPSRPPSSEVAL
jgi:AraC-like DNA-binding protein